MTYPKIGIRPTIDGRWGGVRESLEAQTMGMATAAKALIEENLRYPDGTPVQCVLSPTTIGGGAEAAKCAEYFAGENVVATLTVTPCWCYGSETFDMDPHTIKAVWGFNGTERPGAVYLAAVMAAYAQKGLPAFSIYGHDVQDMTDKEIPADVAEKILRFAHAAAAVGWMKNKAYVNLGGIAMGIAGSFCNAEMFQKYFGIRAEWVDMTEIVRRITLAFLPILSAGKLPSAITRVSPWPISSSAFSSSGDSRGEIPFNIAYSLVFLVQQFVIRVELLVARVTAGDSVIAPQVNELLNIVSADVMAAAQDHSVNGDLGPQFQALHTIKGSDDIAANGQCAVVLQQHHIVRLQVWLNSVGHFHGGRGTVRRQRYGTDDGHIFDHIVHIHGLVCHGKAGCSRRMGVDHAHHIVPLVVAA